MQKRHLLEQYKTYLEKYRYGRTANKRAYRSATILSYYDTAKKFCEVCAPPFAEITQDDIDRFAVSLRQQDVAPAGFNQRMAGLEKFFEYLESLHVSYLGYVPREPVHAQPYVDTFTTKEMNRIIRTIRAGNDLRALAIVMTFITTGVRVSELLQISLADLYTDTFFVIGKGGKQREIFWMPEEVYKIWEEYSKTQRKPTHTTALFTGERGALTRQAINPILKKWVGKARGIKKKQARAHNFRHYFGKWLDEHGFSLAEIATYLGHSQIETTKIYTKRTRSEIRSRIRGALRVQFAEERAEQKIIKRRKKKKMR